MWQDRNNQKLWGPGRNSKEIYTDNILRNVITCGLADEEIQLDLLGERNQNVTSEKVFQ